MMIDYQPIALSRKAEYDRLLALGARPGCEYTFANLYLWGRQRTAVVDGYLTIFSQFSRRSVYPYPVGRGDIRPVLEAIIADAQARGVACRLTGMYRDECDALQAMFPGKFRIHCDRSGFDYVYSIDALAYLKGRKLQKKRNHLRRFQAAHPRCAILPIQEGNALRAWEMAEKWYARRLAQNPHQDFHMEQAAIRRALQHRKTLGIEGLMMEDDGEIIAFTLGSPLSSDTFDVHFEKAWAEIDGAYAAINQAFAQYIRELYPHIRYLNREDDMGIDGLRQAKLSYCPEFLVEKYWACLLEDNCDY
ncbi:MAG TPA: DUF2156 domain-containing protein [Candidatus Faecousia intestinigallinarum]|nr:DUF2156 domain-containing protein [Candidatus Faecousia intestinigallinarum]